MEGAISEPPQKQNTAQGLEDITPPICIPTRYYNYSNPVWTPSIIESLERIGKKFGTSPWNIKKNVLYYSCRRIRFYRSRRVRAHLKRNFNRVPALLKPGGFLFSQRTPNQRNLIEHQNQDVWRLFLIFRRYPDYGKVVAWHSNYLTKQKIRPTGAQ